MSSHSVISADTILAYRETHYRAFTDPPLVLRVDQVNPDLIVAHRRYAVLCSAFITAANPFSRQCPQAFNVQRQQMLAEQLHRDGFCFVEGLGEHPAAQWPAEHSFLVFGLDLRKARHLGARFDQNAVICCASDGVPGLVLLR